MTKLSLIVQREGNRLAPSDPWSAEKLADMREDRTYSVIFTEKRSLPQNNIYWAGLAYAVENIEVIGNRWPSARSLHKSMLLRLGYFTEVPFIQLRDEPVTEKMIGAGARVLRNYGVDVPALEVSSLLSQLYNAMRHEGPHYGVHIVEDSTRFEAMGGEDFTLFFDRAKVVMHQLTGGRDPWDEWQPKGRRR